MDQILLMGWEWRRQFKKPRIRGRDWVGRFLCVVFTWRCHSLLLALKLTDDQLTEWDVEYTRGEKELLAVMELADEQCLSWM